MTQQTFGLFTKPERVRFLCHPPMLPDEMCRADDERRRKRRAKDALRRAQRDMQYEEVDDGQ